MNIATNSLKTVVNSLKIEWLKLKNYNAFWILLSLFVVSIFGINYIVSSTIPAGEMTDLIIGHPFRFPGVWHTVSYMSSFMLLFPGMIIIMTVTGEFGFRTHRQNIIDGVSRTRFISTKMILVLVLAIASTLFVFVVALLFGLSEGGTFSLKGSEYILFFFVQALDYIGIALLISVLIRKTGLCIGLYMVYAMIIENVISLIMIKNFGSVGYFLPLESSDKLISVPVLKEISQAMKIVDMPSQDSLLIAALLYIAIYAFVCKRIFEKSDL